MQSHELNLSLNNFIAYILFDKVEHTHVHAEEDSQEAEHSHEHHHGIAGLHILNEFMLTKTNDFLFYLPTVLVFGSQNNMLRCSSYKFKIFKPPISLA